MKLYKRQIRVVSCGYAGQGEAPSERALTDWLDEEEGMAELEKFRAKAKSEGWWSNIRGQVRYECVNDTVT